MAGADVVDRDPAAEPLQRGDQAPGRRQVFDLLALGHFEHDLDVLIGPPTKIAPILSISSSP